MVFIIIIFRYKYLGFRFCNVEHISLSIIYTPKELEEKNLIHFQNLRPDI